MWPRATRTRQCATARPTSTRPCVATRRPARCEARRAPRWPACTLSSRATTRSLSHARTQHAYLRRPRLHQIHIELGRFTSAAKVQKEIGELYEAEGNTSAALTAFQSAAEYYMAEESHSQANQVLLKVAALASAAQVRRPRRTQASSLLRACTPAAPARTAPHGSPGRCRPPRTRHPPGLQPRHRDLRAGSDRLARVQLASLLGEGLPAVGRHLPAGDGRDRRGGERPREV